MFRLWGLIFILSTICMADIRLERYSISTYSHSNRIEDKPGDINKDIQDVSNLIVLRVGFRQYSNPFVSGASLLSLDNRLTLTDNVEPEIYGPPLVYPNPMRLREHGILGYWLSKPEQIKLEIYNILGRRILSEVFLEGMSGARMGYNTVSITPASFENFDLPAGIYLVFIFDSTQKMIGKTKFAIVP